MIQLGFPGHVDVAGLSRRYDLPAGPTVVCRDGVVLLAAGAVRKMVPDVDQ